MNRKFPYKSKSKDEPSKRKYKISHLEKKKNELIKTQSENDIENSCQNTEETKESGENINITSNGQYLNDETQNQINLEGFLNDKKIREEIVKTKLKKKETIKIIATAGSGKSTTLK